MVTEYLSALSAWSNRQCTSFIIPPRVWENALKACKELGILSSAAAINGPEPSNIVLITCMAALYSRLIIDMPLGGDGVSGRNDDQYPKTVRGPHCLKTEAKQIHACCRTLAFCNLWQQQVSTIIRTYYLLVHTSSTVLLIQCLNAPSRSSASYIGLDESCGFCAGQKSSHYSCYHGDTYQSHCWPSFGPSHLTQCSLFFLMISFAVFLLDESAVC